MHNKKEPVVENKNIMAYGSRTLDPPISIVDQAMEIEKATDAIKTNVNGQLDLIVKQIRFLQDQAKEIIDQAHQNIELHKVNCHFQKIPGEILYLYEKADHSLYFSRLSKEDWQGNPPHPFKGAYKLLPDKTFEKLD